jgi:hypothetical protein
VTGHLARLALQATRPGTSGPGTLRPRTPSLFERPASSGVLSEEYAEPPAIARTSREGPSRADAEVTPDPGRQRPARPGQPRPVVDIPPSTESQEIAGEPARAAPASLAEAEETPQEAPRHARATDVSLTARPEPSSVGVPHLLDGVTGAVTDRLTHVVGPGATAAAVAAPAEDHPDRPGVPGQGPAGSAAPAAEPGMHGETSRSPIPSSQPLPRLTPAPRDDPSPPEVTVNIGRIEVVQPATPERKPPQAPPRTRDSGAPKLADYLRDRSRR